MLFLVLMAVLFFPLRTVSPMIESDAQFRRPQEARTFARALMHPTPFDVVLRDGIFLHGTQGIGKTTFLREDLTPALEDEGALVVYADLQKRAAWRDPVKTLAKAINDMRQKAAENALLPPADVSSSVPSDSIGNALFEAVDRSGRSLVLILDGVEHLLQTRSGRSLLKWLKAARDAVNLRFRNEARTYLLVVAAGSHRYAVSKLASSSNEAFYGALVKPFPVLGEDYVDWVVECFFTGAFKGTSKHISADPQCLPTRAALVKGFEILSLRPGVLQEVLGDFEAAIETTMSTPTETPAGPRIKSLVGVANSGKDEKDDMGDMSGIDAAFLKACTARARSNAARTLEGIAASDSLTRALFSAFSEVGEAGVAGVQSQDFLNRLRAELATNSEKESATGASSPPPLTATAVSRTLTRMMNNGWIHRVSYDVYAASDPQVARLWCAERKGK